MAPRFRVLAAARQGRWLAQSTKTIRETGRVISRRHCRRAQRFRRQPGEAELSSRKLTGSQHTQTHAPATAHCSARAIAATCSCLCLCLRGSGLCPALALGGGWRQPLWEPGGLEILRSCVLHPPTTALVVLGPRIAGLRQLLPNREVKHQMKASMHPPGVSPAH